MRLPSIFSSGALFQADSLLTVRGFARPGDATAASLADAQSRVLSSAETVADEDGVFSLTLSTPGASFDPYTVTITCGGDVRVMEDVLFGELWLATGQSNMEITNGAMPARARVYEKMAGKKLRVFSVDYWRREEMANDPPFPFEPQPLMDGFWLGTEDPALFDGVSALATQFALNMYDALNETADVPVGFLNASWGGTSILSWIPRADIDADPAFAAKLRELGRYPDEAGWNAPGKPMCNFQQTSGQYNVKLAPVEGAQVRGVLWYQGENETGSPELSAGYPDFLRFFYASLRTRFAAFPEKPFVFLSSLIHPWRYGPEGECFVGMINDAFTSTAAESPDVFLIAPNGDLQPAWAQYLCNHPIHPTHKYLLGARMASVALANVYVTSRSGEQKSPAILRSVEQRGDVLRLTFAPVGSGLRIGTGACNAPGAAHPFRPVRCLYVAGSDRRFLPAEACVVAPDVLDVRCDGMERPLYAAFGYQSMEPETDLFAGDYPVAPFCTAPERDMRIEQRPWYDAHNTRVWADKTRDETHANQFYHPVWRPLGESEVCTDPAFCFETDLSLRICGDDVPVDQPYGAFVTSYPYARLTFEGYAALEANVYNAADASLELWITTDPDKLVIPLTKLRDVDAGWCRMRADLSGVPADGIRRMYLTVRDEKTDFRFINVERIRLVSEGK